MDYNKIEGCYYRMLIKSVTKLGNLKNRNVKILDFGCGSGELKKLLGPKVVGYDIDSSLSEIKDWRNADFEVVVVNSVFYLMDKKEIEDTIKSMLQKNPNAEFLVTISNRHIINKILLKITGNNWNGTKTLPDQEIFILKKYFRIEKSKNVMLLSTTYKMIPKKN